jgi:hypothetical protein
LWPEEAYTQHGRAHIRRLRPDWAARPALMSRAAHAVESKAVVRIEVAVRPRPCLARGDHFSGNSREAPWWLWACLGMGTASPPRAGLELPSRGRGYV